MVLKFWVDNLRGDVIRRPKELVLILLFLIVGKHQSQIEIGQFKEALLVDYDVFL